MRNLLMERLVFGSSERADEAAKGRDEPAQEYINVFVRLPAHVIAMGVGYVVDKAFRTKTFLEFYNEYPHGNSEEYRKYHRIRENEAVAFLDDAFEKFIHKKG